MIYLINLIFSCLDLTIIFLKPLTEKIRLQYYVILFFLLLGAEFLQVKFDLSAFFIIGLGILYVIIITINRLFNSIMALFSYFLSVVCNNICLLLLQKIFHISVDKLTHSILISVVFYVLFTALIFGLTHLIGCYVKRHFRPDSFNGYQKLASLVLIEVLLSVAVLIFNVDYGKKIGYPNSTIIYNCILFLLYFILSTLLLLNVIKTAKKNMEIKQKEIEYKQLLDYIKDLEQTSRTLRKFQHDYLNILLSLDLMIHAGSREKLITYFDEHIKPEGTRVSAVKMDLSNLAHISELSIKGIVSHKLQLARLHGVFIKLEITEDISAFYMEPFDLAQVLGFFLDNSIDATSDDTEGFIHVAFIVLEDHLTIVVENSCLEESIPMDSISKEGFSTKGENRGHGLAQVEAILSTYKNVEHYMRHNEGTFAQILNLYPPQDE